MFDFAFVILSVAALLALLANAAFREDDSRRPVRLRRNALRRAY